ncbi:MAG: hypothetical protein GKC03_08250 [Methanomassiliicoccales archaeon]|nr:hypothetical protein [Methanomassiliicoccales archaeon]NYT15623.1 hypothetical protein [Methanomassiliicoccales archaeon]
MGGNGTLQAIDSIRGICGGIDLRRETKYYLIVWSTIIILTGVLVFSILFLDYWYHSTKGGIENTILTFFPYMLAVLALVVLLALGWKGIYIFPIPIVLAISGVLMMHDIGIYLGLYDVFIDWWDKVAHYVAAVIVAYVSFFFLIYLERYSITIRLTAPFIVIFTLGFTCAFGLGWEIYELISDEVLGSTMQYMSYLDTMQDVMSDILGALTVAGIGLWWLKNHSKQEFIDLFSADRLINWTNRKMGRSDKVPAVEAESPE